MCTVLNKIVITIPNCKSEPFSNSFIKIGPTIQKEFTNTHTDRRIKYIKINDSPQIFSAKFKSAHLSRVAEPKLINVIGQPLFHAKESSSSKCAVEFRISSAYGRCSLIFFLHVRANASTAQPMLIGSRSPQISQREHRLSSYQL